VASRTVHGPGGGVFDAAGADEEPQDAGFSGRLVVLGQYVRIGSNCAQRTTVRPFSGHPAGRINQITPAANGDSAAAATATVGPPRKKPVTDANPTTSDFIQAVIGTGDGFLDPRNGNG
jgi:hypothetical protein